MWYSYGMNNAILMKKTVDILIAPKVRKLFPNRKWADGFYWVENDAQLVSREKPDTWYITGPFTESDLYAIRGCFESGLNVIAALDHARDHIRTTILKKRIPR